MTPKPKRGHEAILADVKRLAVEYYEATGRPLGVTGEVAEFEAAKKLKLKLARARTAGYDATRKSKGRSEKIQIKGRRLAGAGSPYRGRTSKIDLTKPFDSVVLVLLDENYETVEIWKAPRKKVECRLSAPGSKSRNDRGSLGISQFKSIAKRVWAKESSRT